MTTLKLMEETLALIGDSSATASRKLRFLRVALGVAKGSAEDLKGLLDGYLDATAGMSGKVELTWPVSDDLLSAGEVLGPAANQVFLNLCLLCLEMQPGCRALSLAVDARRFPLTITVDVTGDAGRAHPVRENMQSAFSGKAGHPLMAKNVQAHIAGRLVRALGGAVEFRASAQGVNVTAVFSESPS